MNTDTFKATGARIVIESLKRLGVERVFALPGMRTLELFDELAASSLETVTTTHENAAVFMADAHARVTGTMGVAIVSGGPGLTNALSGIAEALLDSSPILVLVDTADSTTDKSFRLHEIRQDLMVKPLVKEVFRPNSGQEIAEAISSGAQLATDGEPGPVVIEIPANLFMETVQGMWPVKEVIKPRLLPSPLLDEAAEALIQAKRIGIYAGAGAMDASLELTQLAELLQAPVATTISGRGVIPEDHALSVGYGFGRSGTAVARLAFRKIDTLLAVGCKYGEVATGSYGAVPPKKHIHIDINQQSLNANYPASISIVSDAKSAISGLLERLKNNPKSPDHALHNLIQKARASCHRKISDQQNSSGKVNPSKFLSMLREKLGRDAILVTDCGTHQFWALSDFSVYTPRSFFSPTDFQAMGFSIPAAIAAKLARPSQQVVSLVGDGGFLMSGFEVLTAARLGKKIMIVVFRDNAWGLLKDAQERIYRRTPMTELTNPDFHHIALGLGLEYIAVENDAAIEGGLKSAIASARSCLVDVQVDYSESPTYVKGAARTMFGHLPLSLKAKIAGRFVYRAVFGA